MAQALLELSPWFSHVFYCVNVTKFNFTSTSLFADQDHAEFLISIEEFKFAGGEGNTQFGSDVTDSSACPQFKARLQQLWRAGQLRKQLVGGNSEHSPPTCPCFVLLCFSFVCLFKIFAGAGMTKFFRALDLKSRVHGSKRLPATKLSWICFFPGVKFNSVAMLCNLGSE